MTPTSFPSKEFPFLLSSIVVRASNNRSTSSNHELHVQGAFVSGVKKFQCLFSYFQRVLKIQFLVIDKSNQKYLLVIIGDISRSIYMIRGGPSTNKNSDEPTLQHLQGSGRIIGSKSGKDLRNHSAIGRRNQTLLYPKKYITAVTLMEPNESCRL